MMMMKMKRTVSAMMMMILMIGLSLSLTTLMLEENRGALMNEGRKQQQQEEGEEGEGKWWELENNSLMSRVYQCVRNEERKVELEETRWWWRWTSGEVYMKEYNMDGGVSAVKAKLRRRMTPRPRTRGVFFAEAVVVEAPPEADMTDPPDGDIQPSAEMPANDDSGTSTNNDIDDNENNNTTDESDDESSGGGSGGGGLGNMLLGLAILFVLIGLCIAFRKTLAEAAQPWIASIRACFGGAKRAGGVRLVSMT